MTGFALPDSILDRLAAANVRGEAAWREIGRITEECIAAANGTPRMAIYQSVAYAVGKATVTIRQYHRYEMLYGEMLDEFPVCNLEWLRIATRVARVRAVPVIELFQSELAEADEWGGRPRPPDVWRAQLREGRPTFSPARRAKRAALRNLNTLLRHTPVAGRGAVLEIIKVVNALRVKT